MRPRLICLFSRMRKSVLSFCARVLDLGAKLAPIATIASAVATIVLAILGWKTLNTTQIEYREVVELKNILGQQQAELTNALARVSLLGDIAAAEGGDRFAYTRAVERLWEMGRARNRQGDILNQKLRYSTQRFMGDATNNPTLAFALMGPVVENDMDKVAVMLHGEEPMQRLFALQHILELRLNSLLPTVVQMLEKEPDLNVVQLSVNILNDTFLDERTFERIRAFSTFTVDDCVLHYDEFKSRFEETWEKCKELLLERPRKEVRRIKSQIPPYLETISVYDPEKATDMPIDKP